MSNGSDRQGLDNLRRIGDAQLELQRLIHAAVNTDGSVRDQDAFDKLTELVDAALVVNA
jgi:hypothetical protein